MSEPIDPLLILLQRRRQAEAAYDAAAAAGGDTEPLFAKCSDTMRALLDRHPPATTAAGAIAALDYVLEEGEWNEPGKYAGEDFLRHLIAAARDYIKRQ